ncbi:sex peptide receptor-like [Lingula anatina]|uniref:Sex peptide receptor-like n=1 Tax=Lingula anatina TaxID=7574 RepID=A0A1S3JB35_LINAN|nr:sex peptide receptor-like [Lingula anatina]|eukprot:XP_013407406.1 sex peptide receptor-like [Lingula anatina]
MDSVKYKQMTNDSNVTLSGTFLDENSTSIMDASNFSSNSTGSGHGLQGGLMHFSEVYKNIHGGLAVTICIFGIVANILNIIVLTRKSMRTSTNFILTALAVSDGLTMAAYLPFALQYYCVYGTNPSLERDTLAAAQFLLFYANFSVTVHTVSVWLTVTLAVFRYLYIGWPRHGQVLCSIERAKMAIGLNYFLCPVFCIPNYITLGISNNSGYWGVETKSEPAYQMTIRTFYFWEHAFLLKLIPCFILTIMSILLVKGMKDAEKRRLKLGGHNQTNNVSRMNQNVRGKKTNRTTRMLLVVVILFVITELPQGILNLISGLDSEVFQNVYTPLGDLMDIIALTNSGINFILYCTMSKQFRTTFIELFFKPLQDEARKFTIVATNELTLAGDGSSDV